MIVSVHTRCACDCSRRGRKGQGEAAECLDGEAEDEGRTTEVISGISQDTAHGHHGRHLQLAVVFSRLSGQQSSTNDRDCTGLWKCRKSLNFIEPNSGFEFPEFYKIVLKHLKFYFGQLK